MIHAVLLDLDDTLLFTHTDQFVHQYLALVVPYLVSEYQPYLTLLPDPAAAVTGALRTAIRDVMRKGDPHQTNSEFVSRVFAEQLGFPTEAYGQVMDTFHGREYLTLKELTHPNPATRSLLTILFEMGLKVVVATNPIFSWVAIRERLIWAGVEDFIPKFSLITNADSMHFCKPSPAYYSEILTTIGVPASNAIMVGDSWEQDMIPASKVGLFRWWVDLDRPVPDGDLINGHGTLDKFLEVVKTGWLDTLV